MLNNMYYILMNYWSAACGFALIGAVICGLIIWIVKHRHEFR